MTSISIGHNYKCKMDYEDEPEKYKHRLPVVDAVDVWVIVEVRLDGVEQTMRHLIDFIEDKQRPRTHRHVTSYPVSQLILRTVKEILIDR